MGNGTEMFAAAVDGGKMESIADESETATSKPLNWELKRRRLIDKEVRIKIITDSNIERMIALLTQECQPKTYDKSTFDYYEKMLVRQMLGAAPDQPKLGTPGADGTRKSALEGPKLHIAKSQTPKADGQFSTAYPRKRDRSHKTQRKPKERRDSAAPKQRTPSSARHDLMAQNRYYSELFEGQAGTHAHAVKPGLSNGNITSLMRKSATHTNDARIKPCWVLLTRMNGADASAKLTKALRKLSRKIARYADRSVLFGDDDEFCKGFKAAKGKKKKSSKEKKGESTLGEGSGGKSGRTSRSVAGEFSETSTSKARRRFTQLSEAEEPSATDRTKSTSRSPLKPRDKTRKLSEAEEQSNAQLLETILAKYSLEKINDNGLYTTDSPALPLTCNNNYKSSRDAPIQSGKRRISSEGSHRKRSTSTDKHGQPRAPERYLEPTSPSVQRSLSDELLALDALYMPVDKRHRSKGI